MGVYAGPANAWSNFTDANRIDASTKVVVQDSLVLNLDAGASTSYVGSGTTWTDLSGLGNNGTLTNGPTYNSANGGSLVFDGVNDYVEVTGSNADFLVGSQSFTIEWWEYFTDGTGYSGHLGVFEYKSLGAAPIQIWTQGGLFVTYSSNWNSLGISPTSNQWAHYAISGVSGNFNIYKNGSYVTNSSVNWSLSSSTVKFAIGGTPGWEYGNYATSARFSNVRFYKGKALTASEVSQNFNALRGRFGI
jgi:hypothetical protein